MKGLVILVLIVLLIILIQNRVTSNFTELSSIPKTIWTYWDGPDPPDSVQKCIQTWRNYNPDYDINLISSKNLSDYLPGVDIFGMKMANTPQRTADLVRVHVLAEHGGVWCDSTIMMTAPIDFINEYNDAEFIGFHIGGSKEWPVIENWFFACPPKSDFVIKWRDTFVKINDFESADKYVESIKNQGVDISKVSMPDYLSMHVAAQHVLQKQMTQDDVKKKLKLWKAEDGPLKNVIRNDWKSYEGIKSICSESAAELSPIIKFRGVERDIINKHEELNCVFNGHLN
jgi:hypothetical protein